MSIKKVKYSLENQSSTLQAFAMDFLQSLQAIIYNFLKFNGKISRPQKIECIGFTYFVPGSET